MKPKAAEFSRIIKQHEGVIYKITRIYTNSEDDQKDLYQEIVYQLWKSFESFKGNAKISTWIYRVALNTALYHSKKEKKKGFKVALDSIVLQEEKYDPLFEERLKLVYAKIKTLNDLDKGIMVLFLENRKHEEIALIMGISKSNVGTRISRIKEKLKNELNKN